MDTEIAWNVREWAMTVRPVQPADEALWLELMQTMAWPTRYMRGARRFEDLGPEDARRAVTPSIADETVFVAIARKGDTIRMAGVARAVRHDEIWLFALVVLDEWQRRGAGRRLMRALIDDLRSRGCKELEGEVLGTNRKMLDFVRRLGFVAAGHGDTTLIKRVVLRL